MLTIDVPANEFYDNDANEFITIKETRLNLEHSLISLSKWESKWNKSFLSKSKKRALTYAQSIDYIKCMTINGGVDPNVYRVLTQKNVSDIYEYINAPMSATYFPEEDGPPGKDVITAELIYYWMISLNIPFECNKWHLNRLLSLIRVCNMKNEAAYGKNAGKKGHRKGLSNEALRQRAALNQQRLKQYNTRG